ncbi:hypothetical protein IFM12275_13200 [Nocardia sputorum]|uniref:Uncharacterized protein n=2 Tax=Nocardia sputorum TaxID=2984338 RepID=A0ABN6U4E3_9NOCA|nr:hypothetical protein IFM12275_13200 [Nocardia sputorum]BDT99979.1 hypothetical protein IFM12276_30080 [Nocardia sputorum]
MSRYKIPVMSKYLISGAMIAVFSFGAAGTAVADETVGYYPTHGACVANGVAKFGQEGLGKTWFCRQTGNQFELFRR